MSDQPDLNELAQALAHLTALEHIKQLKARYFQAVDQKDYDRMEHIFTADALVDFSGEIPHRLGHQGITAATVDPADWRSRGGRETGAVIRASVQDLVTVHQGHDPQIELISEDAATGRWPMQDIIDFPDETMVGYGYYLEEYRRVSGEWKISRLQLVRLRVTWEPCFRGSEPQELLG